MTLPQCCADTLDRDGASCVFGCGTPIGDDGMCPRCRDHSGNMFECETCGSHWENWGDGWEQMSGPENDAQRNTDQRIVDFHQRMYGASSEDGWLDRLYEQADLAKKRERGE